MIFGRQHRGHTNWNEDGFKHGFRPRCKIRAGRNGWKAEGFLRPARDSPCQAAGSSTNFNPAAAPTAGGTVPQPWDKPLPKPAACARQSPRRNRRPADADCALRSLP